MKRVSIVFLLIYSQLSWGNSITWVASELIKANKIVNCKIAEDYIRKETEIANEIVKKGLTTIKPKAFLWAMGNFDNEIYYFVSVASSGNCGSAGCGMKLFVSRDNECIAFSSPHYPPNSRIGIDKLRNIYFGHAGKKCNIWKLENNKLSHKEVLKKCG